MVKSLVSISFLGIVFFSIAAIASHKDLSNPDIEKRLNFTLLVRHLKNRGCIYEIPFESNRLRFSLFSKNDRQEMSHLLLDPSTAKGLGKDLASPIYQEAVQENSSYFKELESLSLPDLCLVARDKKTHDLIGYVHLESHPALKNALEISIAISPSQRRKGYATEFFNVALNEGLPYLQQKGFNIQNIVAEVSSKNLASIALLKKFGFCEISPSKL